MASRKIFRPLQHYTPTAMSPSPTKTLASILESMRSYININSDLRLSINEGFYVGHAVQLFFSHKPPQIYKKIPGQDTISCNLIHIHMEFPKTLRPQLKEEADIQKNIDELVITLRLNPYNSARDADDQIYIQEKFSDYKDEPDIQKTITRLMAFWLNIYKHPHYDHVANDRDNCLFSVNMRQKIDFDNDPGSNAFGALKKRHKLYGPHDQFR